MHQRRDYFGKSLLMRDATLPGRSVALSLPLRATTLAGDFSGALDSLLNCELFDRLGAFDGKSFDHLR
jgi:hypothetical protein